MTAPLRSLPDPLASPEMRHDPCVWCLIPAPIPDILPWCRSTSAGMNISPPRNGPVSSKPAGAPARLTRPPGSPRLHRGRCSASRAVPNPSTHSAPCRGIAALPWVPRRRETEIDRVSELVDDTVQIRPLGTNLDAGLVEVPATRLRPVQTSGAKRRARRQIVEWPTATPGSVIIASRSRQLTVCRQYRRTTQTGNAPTLNLDQSVESS